MTAPIFTKDIRLDGRIVLMTGGGGVLGGAMADALLQAGASVLLADVEGAAAESAARDLAAKYDGRVAAVTCDITKEADCDRAVSQAVEIFGGLHVLVNNAGKGPAHMERAPKTKSFKFWEADPDAWREIIDINVCGTYLMARAAAPHLIEQKWGRIVNVTTSMNTMIRGGNMPYGQSKASLEAASAAWADDFVDTGVTCNVLVPGGAADTPMVPKESPYARENLVRPDVMIAPACWLASNDSDGVNSMRFLGRNWDPDGADDDNIKAAGAPAAWPALAAEAGMGQPATTHGKDIPR